MTPQQLTELKQRVEANDPNALYTYAEYLLATDPREAEKYIILAAQLGNPYAEEKLGDKYNDNGDLERAAHYYKSGAKAGLYECSVKLAIINLQTHEHIAIRELEELAKLGIKSACKALAEYHKSHGNRREASYWRSLLK